MNISKYLNTIFAKYIVNYLSFRILTNYLLSVDKINIRCILIFVCIFFLDYSLYSRRKFTVYIQEESLQISNKNNRLYVKPCDIIINW